MSTELITTPLPPPRIAWNKGRIIGQKRPLQPKHVWSIRIRLEMAGDLRDLALFNMAIDSKLRGCDLVRLQVRDVFAAGQVRERASVIQRKTGRPVRFEITESTRACLKQWIASLDMQPEKSLRAIDPAQMAEPLAINAIGPALIMKHVLPLMPRHERSVFTVLSAKVGSIGDNRLGGWHSYRASKAALNQLVRTTAVELRRSHPATIWVTVHPGTVGTGLPKHFSKTGLQVQQPQDAAQSILEGLSKLESEQCGCFRDRFGGAIPW